MLRSERLVLREFRDQDFEAVHAYGADPDVVRYMPWGPNSEAETRDFLERAQSYTEIEPRVEFELAIVGADSGQLIGGIGIHTHGTNAMLGYCLAKPAWGKGYATEAARVVTGFGFEKLSAHRIFASCDPDNTASIGVLTKLGMTTEGRRRQDCRIRGEWRDSLLFSILDDEWVRADEIDTG